MPLPIAALPLPTGKDFSSMFAHCEQLKSIIKFISELAPEYKNLPDRDEIIAQKLSKMGIVTQWGEKKIQENEKIKPTNNPNKAIDKENSKER